MGVPEPANTVHLSIAPTDPHGAGGKYAANPWGCGSCGVERAGVPAHVGGSWLACAPGAAGESRSRFSRVGVVLAGLGGEGGKGIALAGALPDTGMSGPGARELRVCRKSGTLG
ncbi:hypothetical protein GCM10027160_26860 [Streptomyces calidiresistens]